MSEEKSISLFATIGSVYADGVTLIFDGEASASTKRYLVNTSIKFKSGDRVKILPDSGTYVVEYVVGLPKLTSDETHELPSGGTDGQSLLKDGTTSYSVKWGTPDGILPTGGTAGQVLKKSSGTNYAAAWGAVDGTLPTGGTAGQVLKKSSGTNYAAAWGAVDGTLPTGGTTGQVLKKSSSTNYAAAWGDPPTPGAVANQYRPTYESYNIQFQTDYSGNFYIRQGTSGTWKKISVE